MSKRTKLLIALIFVVFCICLTLLFPSILALITGKDEKCDHCGKLATITQNTDEYCAECFYKYNGSFWN